jgi:hypothetical protein
MLIISKDYVLYKINDSIIPYWFPKELMPKGYNTEQPKKSHGIFYVHQFYTKRNLWILSALYDKINKVDDKNLRDKLLWAFTGIQLYATKMNRYTPGGMFSKFRPLIGTLYIASMFGEMNILGLYRNKAILRLSKVMESSPLTEVMVSTQSATHLSNIPENSIDYIFTDPPFGSNLMYSELNFIWEAWLKNYTNNSSEAIINKTQNKDLEDYSRLMEAAFRQYNKILKPNRWITVEFHNSKASVWKSIQKSITNSGFVIAQVSVLDKKYGTFKQIGSSDAVKNDLIINAYKPSIEFTETFLRNAGINLENDFIQMHLEKLPIEPNVERTQQMLYSKLLAQYIQNGFEVRMDASDFYQMLNNYFIERDGYWFNNDQIETYEKRLKLSDNIGKLNINQSVLGISDEKTSIIWLAQFLRKPRTYDEIYIEYSKNLLTSEDKIPELKTILEENFVTEDGKYQLPSIAEKKQKDDLRDKRLTKEFEEIFNQAKSGKKIAEVRKEALLHGLMKLYQNRDVDQIRMIAGKLDARVIESD